MPIKLKKSDIQFGVDNPEKGYMILGFDEYGQLVYKDDNGFYDTIIPTVPTAQFTRLKTDYFTIGYRAAGQFEGFYSYAQGESTISSGYTSFSQGKSVIAEGDYSHSRGENTHAISEYSFVSGKGANNANKLTTSGINTFIHSHATFASGAYGDYSVILGGSNHNINTGANYSIILGGNTNIIDTNVDNSAIIACSGVTSEHDDTVHIPRLVLMTKNSIDTPPDGTIFYNGGDIIARLGGSDVSLSVQTSGLVTAVTASSPLSSSGGSVPNITHSTAAGNKHIPSGGGTDEYLKYGGTSGTAVWASVTTGTVTQVNTTLPISGGPFTTSGTIFHSSAAGYKHIPDLGAYGQILWNNGSGTASWGDAPTGIGINGNISTRVLTATGGSNIQGEVGLTFGTGGLYVDGDVDITGGIDVAGALDVEGHSYLGSNTADILRTKGPTYFDYFDGPTTRGSKSDSDRVLTVSSTGLVKNNLMITTCRVSGEAGTIQTGSDINISSLSHPSEGDWTIYFQNAYTYAPTGLLTLEYNATNSHRFLWIKTITTTYAIIKCEYPDNDDDDRNFSFMAIGWK